MKIPPTFEKQCRSNKAFFNELFVYQSDFPFKPDLIEIKKPNTLVLSRIDGIPYLDVIPLTDIMVTKLAEVISSFHVITHLNEKVLCHWDNQPRNILWDEKVQKFRLIDFEDIRLANPEADLAHLFLFWAEVMCYDNFSQSVKAFITAYQKSRKLTQEHWFMEARKAVNRFDYRRKRYNKLEKINNPDRNSNRRFLLNLKLS